MKEKKYICYSTLKKRWNEKLINLFFKNGPDKKVDNPYYACAAPMKLYLISKVEKIEKRKSFQKAKDEMNIEKHRASAKKAVFTKYDKCLAYADSVAINIPDFERKELEDLAYEHWYDHKLWNNEFFECHSYSEDDLKRWCVNYLRHECTSYDEELNEMYGRVGSNAAHDILQKRINDAIYDKYEWLRR